MVTIHKLNKLTDKQLNTLRETIATTKGNRCKAEKFAQVLSGFATKEVEQPRVGSRIARVYIYNFGSNQHPDRRPVLITCGRFVKWGKDLNSVITSDNQRGIFAGYIINLTDAAHDQLVRAFSDYIF